MINLQKLKGKIREEDKTYRDCARAIECSNPTFCSKMKGRSKFYVFEISKLTKFLHLSDEDILEIFFSRYNTNSIETKCDR